LSGRHRFEVLVAHQRGDVRLDAVDRRGRAVDAKRVVDLGDQPHVLRGGRQFETGVSAAPQCDVGAAQHAGHEVPHVLRQKCGPLRLLPSHLDIEQTKVDLSRDGFQRDVALGTERRLRRLRDVARIGESTICNCPLLEEPARL
jgi:hypothetical protein